MKSITEIPRESYSAGGAKNRQDVQEVTIRFVGDSGDGMQLTGSQFTSTTAIAGNDLSTYPDFPAEIRAPAGTLAGVSGFQIHFSSKDIHTPGDKPEVLVAMNPAALKANLRDLADNGLLILNDDAFTAENIEKAGYKSDPLKDGSLAAYQIITISITTLTKKALEEHSISDREKDRCKNMFALGVAYWLFDRNPESTIAWLNGKFGKTPELAAANIAAMKAGINFGETTELLPVHFSIARATLPPGTYRNITGNEAISLGILAVSELSDAEVFLGSYPITPASDVLHFIAKYPNFRVRTFQAEDEIAAVCSALGASYTGALGVTTSSGPGIVLKSEAINLGVMTELPLVIIDIQRGGPSTGLPTKTEQTDLLNVMFGRNGESPVPVIAARSPSDCFHKVIEAFRIATTYMTPVYLLSESFLANGSEPWRLPDVEKLPRLPLKFRTEKEGFAPYVRDPKTLGRVWAKPGTPGLEHRIGGLEKEDVTGNVSYTPENHDKMVKLRARKIAGIAEDIPELKIDGRGDSKILLVGWGGTYGTITDTRRRLSEEGLETDQIHVDYLNPFPANFETILRKYETVIVIELNLGQMALLIQGNFAIPVHKINKVEGKPFFVQELTTKIREIAGK